MLSFQSAPSSKESGDGGGDESDRYGGETAWSRRATLRVWVSSLTFIWRASRPTWLNSNNNNSDNSVRLFGTTLPSGNEGRSSSASLPATPIVFYLSLSLSLSLQEEEKRRRPEKGQRAALTAHKAQQNKSRASGNSSTAVSDETSHQTNGVPQKTEKTNDADFPGDSKFSDRSMPTSSARHRKKRNNDDR